MKNFLALLIKYLPSVLVGVHAAATTDAPNEDKRAVVLSEVTGVADAVAAASGNPEVQAVAFMVDIAASIINRLTRKKAPVATTPVNAEAIAR